MRYPTSAEILAGAGFVPARTHASVRFVRVRINRTENNKQAAQRVSDVRTQYRGFQMRVVP